MYKNTTEQQKLQRNLSDLLASTRLSTRPDFRLSKASADVCIGCDGRLETDNDFQISIKICRDCLSHYVKIDRALEEQEKHRRREMLEKLTGGVK
jgi:hypothetical protein